MRKGWRARQASLDRFRQRSTRGGRNGRFLQTILALRRGAPRMALDHGYCHACCARHPRGRTGCKHIAPSRPQPMVGSSGVRAVRKSDRPMGVCLLPLAEHCQVRHYRSAVRLAGIRPMTTVVCTLGAAAVIEVMWSRIARSGSVAALLMGCLACLATRPAFAQAAEHVQLIMSKPGSAVPFRNALCCGHYQAIKKRAGRAASRALVLTKTEMWSVPKSIREAVTKEANRHGVDVMEVGANWEFSSARLRPTCRWMTSGS